MVKLPDLIPHPLAVFTAAMVIAGCSATTHAGPDMAPIGAGLKFIGIGLVVMALVFTLGAARD